MMPELNKIHRNEQGQFIGGRPCGFKHSHDTRKRISESMKGKGLGHKRPEHSAWMKVNFISPMTGKKQSPETRAKMSVSHKGIKQSLEWRQKRGQAIAGEKHPNWKGGPKIPRDVKNGIRKSFKYREWRKSVFERDKFTCQKCGQHGGYLEAHHIKSFADCIELRFEVNNGKTLCRQCHRSIR